MITSTPNYPLRDPIYQLIEIIRPLIEVHWGGGSRHASGNLMQCSSIKGLAVIGPERGAYT